MTTKYEFYNPTVDNNWILSARVRHYQTFTPVTDHTITLPKLKLFRVGDTTGYGNVHYRIYTLVGGVPTTLLASGVLDCSAITTDTAGEVVAISQGAGALLAVGTQYGFVSYGETDQDSGAYYRVLSKDGAGGYPSQAHVYSTDSGATWPNTDDGDLWFEEWGDPVASGSYPLVVPKLMSAGVF